MDSKGRNQSDLEGIDPNLRQGFVLNDIVVLPDDGEVIVHGERRHLPPKAFEILLYLCSNPEQLLSSQRLLAFGWGKLNRKRRNLSHVISEIRHALDDHKESPVFIQTITRKGYRLIATVAPLDEEALNRKRAALKAPLSTTHSADSTHTPQWHLNIALLKNSNLFRVSVAFSIMTWLIIQIIAIIFPIFNVPDWGIKIVVLVLVVGFPILLIYTWFQDIKVKKDLFKADRNHPKKKVFYKQLAFDFFFIGALSILGGFLSLHLIDSIYNEKPKVAALKTSLPIQDNLIAVIPFVFDEQSQLPHYFESTFQGEVISALSKQSAFNLMSQRAVNEIPQNSKLSTYAEKLGVRYLVDGAITENAGEFSIILHITDIKTYLQVWSSVVKGDVGNILLVQKQIYRELFNALSLIAQSSELDSQDLISTDDFKAYDSYIQGKSELFKAPTQATLAQAEFHFMKALAFDGEFTLASAGLCQTYLNQYQINKKLATFESAQQICNALTQVSNLKEEGLVALGNLERLSGRYSQSIAFFDEALTLNPKNIEAIIGAADSQTQLGHNDKAVDLFANAIQLEPGYWKNYQRFGNYYFNNGQYKKAKDKYLKVTLLKPNYANGYSSLGGAYFLDDELEKATMAWQTALSLAPNALTYSNLGTALFFRYEFTDAAQSYRKAIKLSPNDPVLWANLADAEKFSGDTTQALQSYQQAYKLAREQFVVNPNDHVMQAMFARYQSELGECEPALQKITSTQLQDSPDPYLFYDMAIAAINCDEKQLAIQYIDNALKLGYSKKLLARDIQFQGVYVNMAMP
ncbi:winged helix-turn-helix domain-containing protein [Shewanella sp. 10N.286.51.B2]|uniref:winged helix-turn-helix domain-containing protein n=1 Tax=Shewanella sp. 10N.286.51.B2 TaxID=3229707 RepID=UPI00354AD614